MAAVSMANNQHVAATVVGKDAAGNPVTALGNINWGNTDNAITNQTPSGYTTNVTAVGPVGSSALAVTNGQLSASGMVTVTAGPLASLEIVFGTPVDN